MLFIIRINLKELDPENDHSLLVEAPINLQLSLVYYYRILLLLYYCIDYYPSRLGHGGFYLIANCIHLI